MGWYFTHEATRRDTIDEITKDQVSETRVFQTHRRCFRGNTMYCLHESGVPGETRKWIGVYLLQQSTSGWGYKPIDESMGPHYYDCPLSYLEGADEPVNEYAKNWREEVRRRAASKKAKRAQPQPTQ